MRYSSRLFLYAPLAIVAALAVAAALLWRSDAGGLQAALERSNGREIAPGVTLHFAHERVGGFPFNVDAVLDDVTFQIRSNFGPIRWHTEHFALHELTLGRAQQIYEAAGTQTLDWTDSARIGHHFVFVPGSLQASAISPGGRLARFDLDINGMGSRDVSGARVQLHFRKSPGHDVIDFVLSADDLHLAPALGAGFGPGLSRLFVQGAFVPAAPLGHLFAGRESWMRGAEEWRENKGAFRLDRLDIAWGAVHAQGTGALALDGAHRPAGDFQLVITGTPDLKSAAAGDARTARALLQLTKVARQRPLHVSVSIASGAVNLAITRMPQTRVSAGLIGALY
jgi:hypothetical protein